MTNFQLLFSLPHKIVFVGYTFSFSIKEFENNLYAGYFVTSCESKTKYKKEAFKLGIWTDKRTKKQTSSVNTPILTAIPFFTESDSELNCTLQALLKNLADNFGYLLPLSDAQAEDISYSELVEVLPYLH